MSAAEVEARLLNLESQFAAFLAGTITMQSLSLSQRRIFIESIFTSGVAIDASDTSIKAGDSVYGEDFTEVNFGNWFFGKALVNGPFVKTGAGAAVENVDIEVKFG